jgi:hypothetical protein
MKILKYPQHRLFTIGTTGFMSRLAPWRCMPHIMIALKPTGVMLIEIAPEN